MSYTRRLADIAGLAHACTSLASQYGKLSLRNVNQYVQAWNPFDINEAFRERPSNITQAPTPAKKTKVIHDEISTSDKTLSSLPRSTTSPKSMNVSSLPFTTELNTGKYSSSPILETTSHDLKKNGETEVGTETTSAENGQKSNVSLPSESFMLDSPKKLKESSIPSSRASRLWHYGGLAASLSVGAIGESFRRAVGMGSTSGSVLMSNKNVDRMVDKLTRMRGAALKLGQMFSIQDTQMLPPELHKILLKVHDSANYMPKWQMEYVLETELGSDWRSYFDNFDPIPIAAASIGQVHAATLRSTGMPVAIKVQYPGVAESIDSDLDNLKTLMTFSSLLPKGLYLDNTIKVMRRELAWECDYKREAKYMVEFGKLLKHWNTFKVPELVDELSTKMVLTSERLYGEPLSKAPDYEQKLRDKIGDSLLRLCLRELFSWHIMQTDPNWSNFFYNKQTSKIELIDFGATRSFDKHFLDFYLHVLQAAAAGDREAVSHWSKQLGYLTGYETELMRQAHIDSVMALGEPFRQEGPDIYDFGIQTVTNRVRENISVMLKHRLTPPPDETYSLHRKLSGVFLLCTKLRARINTKELFIDETQNYVFEKL